MFQMIARNTSLVSVPFACYSIGYYRAKKGWHSQKTGMQNKFVQLIWGISGFGEIILYGQKIPVHPGNVVYYLPGEDHDYTALSDSWEYRWITFDGPLAVSTMLSYEYPRRIENSGECPQELFQEIEQLLPDSAKFNVRHITALLLELLARAGGTTHAVYDRTQIVEHFMELVKLHLADTSLNINVLADMLNVHRSTLNRLIREQLKRSPHNYLISNRALHGLTLLRGTDLPVSEVAIRCGIPNKTHFYSVIRRSVGMSPTEYRRKYR